MGFCGSSTAYGQIVLHSIGANRELRGQDQLMVENVCLTLREGSWLKDVRLEGDPGSQKQAQTLFFMTNFG